MVIRVSRGSKRILLISLILVLVSLPLIALLSYLAISSLAKPKPYIAVIELVGTIDYERPLLGNAITSNDVRELVKTVKEDPFAKAVVLVINSPGGTTAAFEVYEIIKELSNTKVVVAYITGLGTSGGYLIALPAREVVAHPTALVGSVGAIAVVINVKGLMDKLGLNITVVKSGDLKDLLSPFRELTKEDLEVLKRIINGVALEFAEKVREHRGDRIRDYNEVLRAGVYTGVTARDLGLVDRIGSLEDAIARARELSGLPENAPAIWVKRRVSLLDLILSGVKLPARSLDVREPLSVEVLVMWPLPRELVENTIVIRP